ncbi:MAG: lipoyl(octanoyl) transferase LipB [Bacteroidales bacterium]
MSAINLPPSPEARDTSFRNLGLIRFKEAWDIQEELFQSIVSIKMGNRNLPPSEKEVAPNYLLFCEHPHVYTLGKSGSEDNLLINPVQLQANDAEFIPINRGGDVTYHGPGQIVAYPILNLDVFVRGVREYIHLLEETVITMLKQYGINGSRLEHATGVWLDPYTPGRARKICAIGVRTSRWVSMHGLALNINTNLAYFNHINPCGFTDKTVTSLQQELGREIPMEEAKHHLKQAFARVFGMTSLDL